MTPIRSLAASTSCALTLPVIAFTITFGLSLLPILLVDIPAGVDVPNHVARMGVLSRDGASPHPFYEVDWALYPNLAMDLVVPAMARFIPVDTAAKVFYLAGQVLVVTGAAAFEFAHKGRFQLSGFVALAWLYSIPFAWGFMNFTFGCGLALWALACHVWLQNRKAVLRAAAHLIWVTVLFVTHFFALGLFGVTVGLLEICRTVQGHQTWRQAAVTAVWLAAPVTLLLAVLHLSGGAVGGEGTEWGLSAKPLWPVAALNGYSWRLSAGLTLFLSTLVLLAAHQRVVRLDRPGLFVACGLVLLYIAMPFKLVDTAFVDVRVVVFMALVIPAFSELHLRGTRSEQALAIGGASLIVVNLAFVATAHLTYDKAYDELRASFAHVPMGSRVLIGGRGDAEDPPLRLLDYPMYNAPVLAVHFRDAFSPTLFTAHGKQPLQARPSVQALDVPYGGPVALRRLVAAAEDRRASADVPAFARDWVEDYDYLYVVGARGDDPLPRVLTRLVAGERFVLYRIEG